MDCYRGRAGNVAADRAATEAMTERAGRTGVPALRVWAPARQVAFGPRDAGADGYEAARAAARERGYAALERRVGGRAVAYSGTTLAFAHAVPLDDPRRGLGDRYEAATATVADALRGLGVDARPGEPADAYCPGDHSVQVPRAGRDADGRPATGKVAGIAQRVRSEAALVAGCLLVTDRADLAAVLTAVYDALDLPLSPASVGTVAAAGGPADPDRVARALESAFRDGRGRTVRDVTALLDG
jgi:lipoate-protein ligase A